MFALARRLTWGELLPKICVHRSFWQKSVVCSHDVHIFAQQFVLVSLSVLVVRFLWNGGKLSVQQSGYWIKVLNAFVQARVLKGPT
jgi:hypothetical protein